MNSNRNTPLAAIGIPALLAAIGFVTGYFSPLLSCRDCTDAPLNGLFISGPVGLLLGIGVVIVARHISRAAFRTTVAAAALSTAFLGIAIGMPRPFVVGEVVRGQVTGCQSPKELIPAAAERWHQLLAGDDSIRRLDTSYLSTMAAQSDGVVLSIHVIARREFHERRDVWRYGEVTASRWSSYNALERVYARYAGGDCASYPLNSEAVFAKEWEPSNVTPPANVPTFLGLYVLRPVAADWSPSARK